MTRTTYFLGLKDKVAFELGPITAFQESTRGKNILNVRCEKGGKAVKISNFVKTKSVGEFAILHDCDKLPVTTGRLCQ